MLVTNSLTSSVSIYGPAPIIAGKCMTFVRLIVLKYRVALPCSLPNRCPAHWRGAAVTHTTQPKTFCGWLLFVPPTATRGLLLCPGPLSVFLSVMLFILALQLAWVPVSPKRYSPSIPLPSSLCSEVSPDDTVEAVAAVLTPLFRLNLHFFRPHHFSPLDTTRIILSLFSYTPEILLATVSLIFSVVLA